MAIKRKDIREILSNENFDSDAREKALLDLIHREVDELKDENDKLTAELEKAEKTASSATAEKDKAEKALSDYKADVENKETRHGKEAAYRKLLTETGVADKRIAAILKCTDIDSIELNKDGSIKDADKHRSNIESEWSEFITEQQSKGADVPNPPSNRGAKMTKADIMKIKDTSERQKAIAENHDLFGI